MDVSSLNTNIYRGQQPLRASDKTEGTQATNPLETQTSSVSSRNGQDTLTFIPKGVKERIEVLTDNSVNEVVFYDDQGNHVRISKVDIDDNGRDIYEYQKTPTDGTSGIVKIQFSFNNDPEHIQRAQNETERVYQGVIDNGANAAANRSAMQEVKQDYQEGFTLTIYQYEDSSQMSESEDVTASATMLAGSQPLWGTKDGLGLLEEAVELATISTDHDAYTDSGREVERQIEYVTPERTATEISEQRSMDSYWGRMDREEKQVFLVELYDNHSISRSQLDVMLSSLDRNSNVAFSEAADNANFDINDRNLSGSNPILDAIKDYYDNKEAQWEERKDAAGEIISEIFNTTLDVLAAPFKAIGRLFSGPRKNGNYEGLTRMVNEADASRRRNSN